MPFGIAMYWASVTKWKPFSVVIAASFGTTPRARGLMSQPTWLAIMSREPSASSFIVAAVPVG